LEEVKTKYNSSKYVYGNVAYDIEEEIAPRIKKNTSNKKKTSREFSKLQMVGKIIVVFALSFLLVYRFAIILELTYDIRNIKTEIASVIDTNENIKIDLAGKNNLRDIEKIAVGKRGMIVPEQNQIQYVCVKPLTPTMDKYSPSAFQMMQRLLVLIY
jgi:cell division protein FtsL